MIHRRIAVAGLLVLSALAGCAGAAEREYYGLIAKKAKVSGTDSYLEGWRHGCASGDHAVNPSAR
ncbi:MAG: hypothetical protein KatS3mg119_1893 [Rhodothalassiaceae bacterium]|nr:MAG: hypothetical protein KatS3mg119_1893 [Rhodothalassiaceae bacterium]